MWWTIAAAFANPTPEASLAVVVDETAAAKERVRAAKELGRLDVDHASVREIVTPLASTLQTELPERLSGAIRKTLLRLDATSVWTQDLDAVDARTRARAANLLGREGQSVAGPALVAVLDDPDSRVREAAAGALAGYPSANAIDPLALRLKDPTLAVRLAASQSLGFLGGEVAQDALRQARVTELDAVARHYFDAALGRIQRQLAEKP